MNTYSKVILFICMIVVALAMTITVCSCVLCSRMERVIEQQNIQIVEKDSRIEELQNEKGVIKESLDFCQEELSKKN